MTDDRFNPDAYKSLEGRTSDTELDDQKIKEEAASLIRALRDMPDRKPPTDLADRIVCSIKPKQISLWRRFFLWAASPRSLTVLPIKLIPAAAAVCIALLLTIHFFPKRELTPMSADLGKQELVSVVFTFEHPQARSVSLIGSFNQWNPRGFEMRSRGQEKVWVLELRLPPGRYEYAFIVDGEVVKTDPTSPFSERDGFGNQNSIIFVTDDYAKNI